MLNQEDIHLHRAELPSQQMSERMDHGRQSSSILVSLSIEVTVYFRNVMLTSMTQAFDD